MTEAPKPPSQSDKFRDLARELECDDDEAAFEETVRTIATNRAVEFRVDFAKRGPGFTAVPIGGASPVRFEIFPTPQAVRDWLGANNYQMIDGDPDRWAAPAE